MWNHVRVGFLKRQNWNFPACFWTPKFLHVRIFIKCKFEIKRKLSLNTLLDSNIHTCIDSFSLKIRRQMEKRQKLFGARYITRSPSKILESRKRSSTLQSLTLISLLDFISMLRLLFEHFCFWNFSSNFSLFYFQLLFHWKDSLSFQPKARPWSSVV